MNKPSYYKHRLLKSCRNLKKQIKGVRWWFSDSRAMIQDEGCKGRFGKGIKFGVAVSRIILGSRWERDLSLPQSFLAPYEDKRGYLNANLILLSRLSDKDQRNILGWKWLQHYIIVRWPLPEIRILCLLTFFVVGFIYLFLLRSVRAKMHNIHVIQSVSKCKWDSFVMSTMITSKMNHFFWIRCSICNATSFWLIYKDHCTSFWQDVTHYCKCFSWSIK